MISGKTFNFNSPLRQNFFMKRYVTNAELLASFTTALTLVSGQAGTFFIPRAVHFYKEAGTAYTLNGSTAIGLYYGSVAGQAVGTVNPTGFMDQTGTLTAFAAAPNSLTTPVGSFTAAQITAAVGTSLVIANAVANFTGGTGGLFVSCFYEQYPAFIAFS